MVALSLAKGSQLAYCVPQFAWSLRQTCKKNKQDMQVSDLELLQGKVQEAMPLIKEFEKMVAKDKVPPFFCVISLSFCFVAWLVTSKQVPADNFKDKLVAAAKAVKAMCCVVVSLFLCLLAH